MKKLLQENTVIYQEVAPKAKNLAEAKAIVARIGSAWMFLPSALQQDLSLMKLAIKTSPACYIAMGDARSNRELAFLALSECSIPYVAVPEPLKSDVAFLRECAQKNPLLLECLPNSLKQEILLDPKTRTAQERLQTRLLSARISPAVAARVGRITVLQTLLDQREHPARADGRPLMVLFGARADHNGALAGVFENIHLFVDNFRVIFYEISKDTSFAEDLTECTAEQSASHVFISGHGSMDSIALNAPDPALNPTRRIAELATQFSQQQITYDQYMTALNEVMAQAAEYNQATAGPGAHFDLNDKAKFMAAGIAKCIASGGRVILYSCHTGEGDPATNIAGMFAELFPHAHVHAPSTATSGSPVFDGTRFISPGFAASKEYHVHLAPTTVNVPD